MVKTRSATKGQHVEVQTPEEGPADGGDMKAPQQSLRGSTIVVQPRLQVDDNDKIVATVEQPVLPIHGKIQEVKDKIAKLAGRIILAENAFQALGDNDSLRTLFTQSPFLESWINPHDTRKDQANALRTRIDESRKEKAQLQDRENALRETHLLLLQARLDKVTQQTRNDESNVPTEVTGLASG